MSPIVVDNDGNAGAKREIPKKDKNL